MPYIKVIFDNGALLEEQVEVGALPTAGDMIQIGEIAYAIATTVHHMLGRHPLERRGAQTPVDATVIVKSEPQMCIKWPPA